LEIASGATVQVFGGKEPSVEVTDASGKKVASIPIGMNPGKYVYSKASNTLYVVQNENKLEHTVSAVNLTTSRVDRTIEVGTGREVRLLLSSDERRLFCYTASSGNEVVQGTSYYSIGSLKPPYEPVVYAIDTISNDTIATYRWFRDFSEAEQKGHYFSSLLLSADDTGSLALESIRTDEVVPLHPKGQQLIVFSGRSPDPVIEADPGGPVVGPVFSQDGKLLISAVQSDQSTGKLIVFDLEKRTTASHDLPDHPTVHRTFVDVSPARWTGLLRLGSKQELWVLGDKEMRSVTEAGELGDRYIPLNNGQNSEGGGKGGDSPIFDGLPGETITLGEDHAAILINSKNGSSRHRVALLDLKRLQLDGVVPTMRPGEAAGIETGRVLGAVLILAVATASRGIIDIPFPNYYLRNEALAARPDGRTLYALDIEGHEVTVIDVQTAKVVTRVSVDGSVTKIQVSSDSKRLLCFGQKTQQIDLDTNNLEN
jgi:YVTN family beta-propeller protein